jgi:hypothetical protein
MNPETQIILDELARRFDDLEAQTTEKFQELDDKLVTRLTEYDDCWERKIADLQVSHDARLGVLERAAASFEDWMPGIEGSIDDIRLEVGKLSKHWERTLRDRSPPLLPQGSAPMVSGASTATTLPCQDFTVPLSQGVHLPSASERPPASDNVDRLSGNRFDKSHREDGFGSVTTLVHPPVKGAL